MKTKQTVLVGIILANLTAGCAARSTVASDATNTHTVQHEVSHVVAPAQSYAVQYRNTAADLDALDVESQRIDACETVEDYHTDLHMCEGPFARGGTSYSCVYSRHNGAPMTEDECSELGAQENAEADYLSDSKACSLRWY